MADDLVEAYHRAREQAEGAERALVRVRLDRDSARAELRSAEQRLAASEERVRQLEAERDEARRQAVVDGPDTAAVRAMRHERDKAVAENLRLGTVLRAAFLAGVDIAREHADVSTWDGWHVTNPRIDWDAVDRAAETFDVATLVTAEVTRGG